MTLPCSVNLTRSTAGSVRIWRTRPPSPCTRAGTSWSILRSSRRPRRWTCSAATAQTCSTIARRSKSVVSSSSRPASIFETSRMSLMIASSCSPECRDLLGEVALLVVESGVEQQLGHADHAVHRRADLVAHVGQERRLHVRRLDRLVARDRQLGVRAVALGHVLAQAHAALAAAEHQVVARDLDVDDRAVLELVAPRARHRQPAPPARRQRCEVRPDDLGVLGRSEILDGLREELLAAVAVAEQRGVGDGDDPPRRLLVDQQRLGVALEQQPVLQLARARLVVRQGGADDRKPPDQRANVHSSRRRSARRPRSQPAAAPGWTK